MNPKLIGKLHRLSALILTIFIVAHLINHLCAYFGPETHIALMEKLRIIYRSQIGEGILLAAILIQIITGIVKVFKIGLRNHDRITRLQIYSGLYLSFFLLAHTTAVLVARNIIGLETNFFFGASALYLWPFQLFFIPYYTLSIVSFFTHTGCVLRWVLLEKWGEKKSDQLVYQMIFTGIIISGLLIFVFSGLAYEIEISDEIKAWFNYGQ